MNIGAAVVTELGVITAAILAALGWMIRHRIASDRHRDEILDTLGDDVSILREGLLPLRTLVDSHDRRIAQITESNITLTVLVEQLDRRLDREVRDVIYSLRQPPSS